MGDGEARRGRRSLKVNVERTRTRAAILEPMVIARYPLGPYGKYPKGWERIAIRVNLGEAERSHGKTESRCIKSSRDWCDSNRTNICDRQRLQPRDGETSFEATVCRRWA